MDPSPSISPASVVPPTTSHCYVVPPIVSSKDKTPMVVDPPSSFQYISNIIECK